ncbi:MAG: RsfS/YbeB/iojap family protein, partial [Victivallales bacterium]|nr:RsfS/YbeB/iojap family protein [Victivallales bacterium]
MSENTIKEAPAVLDSDKLAKLAVQICEETKAKDILLFKVSENVIVADYYLVCSGTSMPHIRAIADHIKRAFNAEGVTVRGQDG